MNFFAAHGYKFQIFSAEKQYVNVRLKDYTALSGSEGAMAERHGRAGVRGDDWQGG